MAKRKIVDWEGIEKQYRIGLKTLRVIASEYGLSHVAIVNRAKKQGWIQDKSDEVREKTKAALFNYQRDLTKLITKPTADDIQQAVETNIAVIIGHRKTIRDGHALVDLLQSQLDIAAIQRDEIETDIIDETASDKKLQRRNAMLRAVSLPSHANIVKDLSFAIKNLIGLERQAFSLDEDGSGGLRDLISHLSPASKQLIAEALGVNEDR